MSYYTRIELESIHYIEIRKYYLNKSHFIYQVFPLHPTYIMYCKVYILGMLMGAILFKVENATRMFLQRALKCVLFDKDISFI